MSFTSSNNGLSLESAAGWVEGALVTPPPVGATVCWMPSCQALAFAEVRAHEGRMLICLTHYEAAREIAQQRRALAAAG